MSRYRAVFAAVAVLCAACASTGETASRSSSTTLTREEIASVNVANLYDVVSRIRPRWLVVRGSRAFAGGGDGRILVYQGTTYLGDVEILRQLDPDYAQSMRYLDAATANATLSATNANVHAAIVIETRAR